jgi:hypothetical protein
MERREDFSHTVEGNWKPHRSFPVRRPQGVAGNRKRGDFHDSPSHEPGGKLTFGGIVCHRFANPGGEGHARGDRKTTIPIPAIPTYRDRVPWLARPGPRQYRSTLRRSGRPRSSSGSRSRLGGGRDGQYRQLKHEDRRIEPHMNRIHADKEGFSGVFICVHPVHLRLRILTLTVLGGGGFESRWFPTIIPPLQG